MRGLIILVLFFGGFILAAYGLAQEVTPFPALPSAPAAAAPVRAPESQVLTVRGWLALPGLESQRLANGAAMQANANATVLDGMSMWACMNGFAQHAVADNNATLSINVAANACVPIVFH